MRKRRRGPRVSVWTPDIVTIVKQYVQLEKSGERYVGLCPFHKEETPSFTVDPDTQTFHCFGCNAAGTAQQFTFRMEAMRRRNG